MFVKGEPMSRRCPPGNCFNLASVPRLRSLLRHAPSPLPPDFQKANRHRDNHGTKNEPGSTKEHYPAYERNEHRHGMQSDAFTDEDGIEDIIDEADHDRTP